MSRYNVSYSYDAPTEENPRAFVRGAAEVTLTRFEMLHTTDAAALLASKIPSSTESGFKILAVTELPPTGDE
tara:strand:+ start:372 stop:587 length:216 start_codon:yes stop_codon:yes gene_type:complete